MVGAWAAARVVGWLRAPGGVAASARVGTQAIMGVSPRPERGGREGRMRPRLGMGGAWTLWRGMEFDAVGMWQGCYRHKLTGLINGPRVSWA